MPAATARRGDLLLGQFVSDLLDNQLAKLIARPVISRPRAFATAKGALWSAGHQKRLSPFTQASFGSA